MPGASNSVFYLLLYRSSWSSSSTCEQHTTHSKHACTYACTHACMHTNKHTHTQIWQTYNQVYQYQFFFHFSEYSLWHNLHWCQTLHSLLNNDLQLNIAWLFLRKFILKRLLVIEHLCFNFTIYCTKYPQISISVDCIKSESPYSFPTNDRDLRYKHMANVATSQNIQICTWQSFSPCDEKKKREWSKSL